MYVLAPLVLLSLAGAGAPVDAPPPRLRVEESYCAYLRSVAASERALLSAPEVVARAGLFDNSSVTLNVPTPLANQLRVTAGLQANLRGIYQGVLLAERAETECVRYRASRVLRERLRELSTGATRRALEAKAQSLDGSEREAGAIVARVETAVAQSRATVEELNAIQLRLTGLRQSLGDVRRQLAALPHRTPETDRMPLDLLVSRHVRAEGDAERTAGAVRRALSWDLVVAGGYDYVLSEAARSPFFGQVTFTFNLGRLWQSPADDRAEAAREEWAREQVEGADRPLTEVLDSLREAHVAVRRELSQNKTLLDDLEKRFAAVQSIELEQVAKFRDVLWFERAKLRAEHHFLEAYAQDLGDALAAPALGAQ